MLSARRTLLWDLDPQGASSFILSVRPSAADRAQKIFEDEAEPGKLVHQTDIPRLGLIPADESLYGLNRLLHQLDKKRRLQKLLTGLAKDHDRILLDCAPGLTETSAQVIRAADLIVVPVIPSPLSQRALDALTDQIGGRSAIMPVHVMVDRRRALHARALDDAPDWPVIPMASVVERMAMRHAPVGQFAPRTAAAAAFARLWQAIEKRLADRPA